MNGMSPDTDWPRVFPGSLTPIAATWVEDCIPKDTTWEELSRRFIKRLGEPGKIKRRRVELVELRPGPKESAADFCRRYQELALAANIEDDNKLAVEILVARLPPSVEMQVAASLEDGRIRDATIDGITQYVCSVMVSGKNPAPPATTAAGNADDASTSSRRRPYGRFNRRYGHSTTEPRANNRANANGDKNASHTMHSSGQRNQFTRDKRKTAREPSGNNNNNDGARGSGVRELGFTTSGIPGHNAVKLKPYPVMANGINILAVVDTGANITFVAKQFVDEHNIAFTPTTEPIRTISKSVNIPGIGRTEPIHLVSGQIDVMHCCEIIGGYEGHPLIIGRDLALHFMSHTMGLPLESTGHGDPAEPAVVDTAPPLADVDFAKAELEPDFVQHREAFMLRTRDALETNVAVPAEAYYPMPQSVVHLDTPPVWCEGSNVLNAYTLVGMPYIRQAKL